MTNLTLQQLADFYLLTKGEHEAAKEALAQNDNIDYTKSLEARVISTGDILRDITMHVAMERSADFKAFGALIGK